MNPGEFEHEYDLGKLQVVNPDRRTFSMFVAPRLASYYGERPYEEFTSDLLLSLIKDNTLFIDIGAHYGYYTLLVGTKNPQCKIVSFEPVPETTEVLKRNIELNKLKNVKVYNLALSNKNETSKFNITEASDCCGFYENPITRVTRVVDVQAATLDSLINKTPKVPVIIKIDTEGHEVHVLEGMEKLLKNTADISLIIEFNPKCLRRAGNNPSDLLEKILQSGFEIYFVNDDKREIDKLDENNIEDWKNHVLEKTSIPGIKTYKNILCVKNSVELKEILRNKISVKMKTLLINPDTPTFYQFGGASSFPIGLGYIAAVLEKDYDVKVIDVGAEGLNDETIKKRVAEIEPKIVGITSDTLSFQRAIDIATIVKQIDKKIIVVIGGAHSNALPSYPLKYDCFDISVYGEGERTAVELWERLNKGLSYKDVKGICFRHKGEIVVNPGRELVENLDELPFPARHLFPMDKYRGDDALAEHPVYTISTSRGCPYSCAFCSNNVAFGKKYRFRSTKNVVDEIDILINQYEAKGIYFREDLFTANKQRVKDLCEEIGKRGLHFKWECESRINTVDEELLTAMKKAGCEIIWFGVESGSQRILDLLNKQINHVQIRKAFDLCEKVGIKAGASMILGVPGETIEEIQKTIEFAEELKLKAAWIGFVVFTAFPVSPLYKYVKQNMLYEKEVRHGIPIVKTDEFDRATLETIRQYAIDRIDGKIIQEESTTPAQRELRNKLLSHLIEGQKVLEIGCENGDLSIEVARLGFEIVGIDISEPGINQATNLAKQEKLDVKTRFIVMDAIKLDFPDNSFDTILIPEIPEHFKDPRKVIAEAIRVVRNGGRVIISVPEGLRVLFAGHLRAFFKDTLSNELEQYAENVTWHRLPFEKWLICSFFVNKIELAIKTGPTVNVIMPTYNGRENIVRAIKSVVSQTYQRWELIVVNDGGDDIADTIELFGDKRIKYIQAEHKGKSHALNVGIENSRGRYISYLDDDDLLYPIHLECLVKTALDQKKDFVYCDWYEVSFDENDRQIAREFSTRQNVPPWTLITQNYINHKCILHSRKLLEKTGNYDERLDLLIDWDMIRRLAFVSPPFHLWSSTSEHMVYYRGNVMQNRISSLWIRDQEKARKSMEIIIRKTTDLGATTNDVQQAIVHAMLHRTYYHTLEFIHATQAKDSQITRLEEELRKKDAQITSQQDETQNVATQANEIEAISAIKDAQIAGLESALEDNSVRVNKLEIVLTNSENKIKSLESALKEKDARIGGFNLLPQWMQRWLIVRLLKKVYTISKRVCQKIKNYFGRNLLRVIRYYRRYGLRRALGRIYQELRTKGIIKTVVVTRPLTESSNHVIKFHPHQSPLPTTSRVKRVAFLIGCLEGESKRYRVHNVIEGLVEKGIDCYTFYDINLDHIDELLHVDVVVIFRAAMWEYVDGVIEKCQVSGIPVVFDIDDLVFEPESIPFVDGITKYTKEQKADYISGVKRYRETLLRCDFATCTTDYLAERLQLASGKKAFVVPNTINKLQYNTAEEILRKRKTRKREGEKVKIVYFSGTYTHNKDFLEASGAICEILRKYKNAEFHLIGELDLPEEFDEFRDRIVIKGFMPYLDMLTYLAEMDINIAPLELNNPFTAGKSELKIFEAGMVNVSTVASKTDSYSRCVNDGENGFLAGTKQEWVEKISRLIEDKKLREKMGANARQHFLKKFYIDNVVDGIIKVYEEIMETHLRKPVDLKHIDIGWVIPEPFAASGGHRNIFRTVKKLNEFGHKLTMYFLGEADIQTMKRIVNEHFYKIENVNYIKYDGRFRYHDVCFATHWSTVYPMMENKNKIKYPFYFIQDFEPLFFAMGTGYIQAENTYKMGLTCITSGPWPAAMLKSRYGIAAESFRFPVDKTIYNKNVKRTKENKNIIFFAKPEMPRRCYEIGIAALKLVKEQRPDIEIILFGSNKVKDMPVPFEGTKLGLLPGMDDLAKLYRNADLGIVFSTTNPSLVPYEMMACELAVGDMRLEDSIMNYESEENVYLLNPMIEIMAQEISSIIDNDTERQRKAANGYNFVQGFPDEEGMVRRIEKLIKKRISGDSTNT